MSTTVNHRTLGIGTVIAQDNKNVTVDFNGITKVLMIEFAPLTNEDGTPFYTAPAAPAKKTYKAPRKASAKELENNRIEVIKRLIDDVVTNSPALLAEKFSHIENDMIISIVAQARRNMRVSEKQLYVLAKFANENNIEF